MNTVSWFVLIILLLAILDDCTGCWEYCCAHKDSAEFTTADGYNEIYICEGDSYEIKCKDGVIDIADAYYGRSDLGQCTRCDGSANNYCNTPITNIDKNSLGQGQEHFTVRASNDLYGDPCKGILKYLYMKYKCTEQ